MFNKPGISITKNLLFGDKPGKDTLPPPNPVPLPSSATEKTVETIDSKPSSPLEFPTAEKPKRRKKTKKPPIINNLEMEFREKSTEIAVKNNTSVSVEWEYDGMNIPWIQ